MKVIKTAMCLSALLLLSGCTALLWGGNEVVTHGTESRIQFQDNVTAAFQYKNLAASAIQNGEKIPLNIPPEGMAFMGEKNIYILTKGAGELLSLNKLATRIPLISGQEDNTLKLQMKRPTENDVVIHFSDTLRVDVNKSINALSDDERRIIQQSDFRDNGMRYVRDVDVEGVIIPRKDFNYPLTNTESLERRYRVEFYVTGRTTDFHPVNLATNVVFTPLALAADIVFFPISISMLELISGSSSHH